MIISSRFPRVASHRPIIVSDSPPKLPGTHTEYVSAVSIKFPPAAAYEPKTANDCFSSAVHPNTFPPSASGKTSSSVELILAISRSYWSIPVCRGLLAFLASRPVARDQVVGHLARRWRNHSPGADIPALQDDFVRHEKT